MRALLDTLRRQAERSPEAKLIDLAGECLNYGDFWQQANRLAGGFASVGAKPGTPVAVMLENSLDALRAWFGILATGGFDAALNPELRGALLAHQLNDSRAELLVCEAHLVPIVGSVASSLRHLKRIACRGVTPAWENPGIDLIVLDEIRNGVPHPALDDPDDMPLSSILYTGGTTGPSKGCMIGQRYFHEFCIQHNRAIGFTPDDVMWTPLPLFHINARSTFYGAVLTGGYCGFDERFSVRAFWPSITRTRATYARVIAGMFRILADAAQAHPRPAGSTLKRIVGSGATPELSERFERHWQVPAIAPGYGMTEASMIVDIGTDWSGIPRGSVGRRNEAYDVEVVDEGDNILAPGKIGEIVVRPRTPDRMFSGYWMRPEDTLARYRNLWFHTGDLGKFDDDGWFYFTGRKDDFVRRRGENIPAFEVESVVLQHPAVSDAAIHSVPSDTVPGDEEVKLTAVLRPGASIAEAALCAWLATQLPKYAVPRFVEFRPALPKGAVGRIAKHLLKKDGVTAATWDRDALPPKTRDT